MNGRTALAMLALIALSYLSREADHAREVSSAAEGVAAVFAASPPPERIGTVMGWYGAPVIRAANIGRDRTIYDYAFEGTGRAMSRIFRVEDGVVTQARCEAGFGLMKGVPYELLEQVFTDALSDFFKSPPERWDDNSLADPRAVFTWRAPLPGGGMCEATLSVIRKERRRPEISRWPPRYLWTKPEDVAVLLHVTPAR